MIRLLSAAVAAGTGDGIHRHGDLPYAVATHTDHTGVGVNTSAPAIGAFGNRECQHPLATATAYLAGGQRREQLKLILALPLAESTGDFYDSSSRFCFDRLAPFKIN